jgi:hypothetical protein
MMLAQHLELTMKVAMEPMMMMMLVRTQMMRVPFWSRRGQVLDMNLSQGRRRKQGWDLRELIVIRDLGQIWDLEVGL